jgi:hypothetical protein
VEGPIRIRELGDNAHVIPAAQLVRNQNRLSSKADFEILSSFPRKKMITNGNQVPFSPKEDLVEGKVEHAPRLPKGINITP